ncbi:glycosyl hydrolase family 59 [Kribbella sp. VKM Ac-2527]|uniref:galactosylceramidase n=1 Tax=Kribbella caucasensis TaxID=2512215 RepID=A0A4R6KKX5_9ACTN|nr:hypothetical protein [Kribbella sp. VKM Ac-2527]TDO51406.1 glycosyl hydrolase family 59 [Kribbella sp. VKM Ac-2527]
MKPALPRRTRRSVLAIAATTAIVAAALPTTAISAPLTDDAAPKRGSSHLRFGDDSSPWSTIVVDGDDVERDAAGNPFNEFGGFGSVSCNNTSRLLLDYREEHPDVYWKLLNLMFNQRTGAGLSHLKVELGADVNTSSGAEPASKRSADEPANVLRGAGFRMIADAKKINPHLSVEALRWAEPSWTGNRWEDRYRWYKETIDAAYDTYGVKFDYLSPSQNEVHSNYMSSELAWTVYVAKRLEQDAKAGDARYDYAKIKIVALDSYRNGERVSDHILNSPEALEQVDAIGIHYTIGGGPNLTRLNKDHGMEVIYSEGVAPMIDPQYRITAEPARGGVGGAVSAVDIADRFINSYRWSGSGENPAHMTSFLFQPAVSALYEGSSYSPKHLIRASDPWSGYYEGGVGIVLVRHFMQFIGKGWEYIEGASYGDGPFADGGTAVDASTRTYLTLREPALPARASVPEASAGRPTDFAQVHANNTAAPRYFEVKVADLGTDSDTPLHLWRTKGPDSAGQPVDANWFQHLGYITPDRTERGADGTRYSVYRVEVQPYSILSLTTRERGVHQSAAPYAPGDYAATAEDAPLELPYSDDFEYAGYPTEDVNGVKMSYLERRGRTPRYTADQNGAFEVIGTDDTAHRNVLQQKIHAGNRGYTWNVWGNGSQNQLPTGGTSTILGDHTWANYRASIDVRFDQQVRDATLPNYAGLGVRQIVSQGADLAAYALRVVPTGAWELRKLDSVVAAGTIDGFDPAAWHRLSLEAVDNVLTPSVDGRRLTTWTDSSANPVMSGRISLLSGHYQNQWDNLDIDPIGGHAWRSDKLDDTSPRLGYQGAVQFQQVGFANHNRTLHVLRSGGAAAFSFNGTGLNLFGATGTATLNVSVDGAPPTRVAVGPTGVRQTSYWLRGLDATNEHTVEISVVDGSFTLDGIDLLGPVR